MTSEELIANGPDKSYILGNTIHACMYNEATKDCEAADLPELVAGTVLTYVKPDEDSDGHVFHCDNDGSDYVLHALQGDLDSLEPTS